MLRCRVLADGQTLIARRAPCLIARHLRAVAQLVAKRGRRKGCQLLARSIANGLAFRLREGNRGNAVDGHTKLARRLCAIE